MRLPTWAAWLPLLLSALLIPRPTASAEPAVIKLATLVPDGSVWDKILKDMGAEWTQGTQGRVVLRVYPGGVVGDEPDMVRKMRIGQLQAAALTTAGLSAIDPAFKVFGVPMFYDSYPEMQTVLRKIEPTLRQRLEARGFILLNWGHGGWVYFFSKQPVQTVADLKRVKMFAWAGDDEMVQLWKGAGYQPVALAATDVLPGLQTGMIEAIPTTPLAALSLQWFRSTPCMAQVGLAPLVGGVVITKQAWGKIAETDRATVLQACRKAERRLEVEVPHQDTVAVAEMQKRGLRLIPVPAANAAEWHTEAEIFARKMRGAIVPIDIMDAVERERGAYRQQHPAGAR